MKLRFLSLALLCITSSLFAQRNDVVVFEETPPQYANTNLYTSGPMVYLLASWQKGCKIHAFNSSNLTAQTIDIASRYPGVEYFRTTFLTSEPTSYLVVGIEQGGEDYTDIYEIKGGGIGNKHSYKGMQLDTAVLTRNFIYMNSWEERAQILVFDLNKKTFNKLPLSQNVRYIHPLGDTLICSASGSKRAMYGLTSNGTQWRISNDQRFYHRTASFDGALYGPTGSNGLYKTDGSKDNLSLISPHPPYDASVKSDEKGLLSYHGNRGIFYLAKGKTTATLIWDNPSSTSEPFRLNDQTLACFSNNKLQLLNTEKLEPKDVTVTEVYSYLRGMASNVEEEEVYFALSTPAQSDQLQNIYGYDASGTLIRYNTAPLIISKEGYISDFVENNGFVFFTTFKSKNYRLHAVPIREGEKVKRVKVDAFIDRNENGVRDPKEASFKDFTVRDVMNGINYPNNDGSADISVFQKKNKFRVNRINYWKLTTDSVFDIEFQNSTAEAKVSVGLTKSNPYTVIEGFQLMPRTRCGFDGWIRLKMFNRGNMNVLGSIRFEYDTLLTINSHSVTPDSVKKNELYWNLDSVPYNSSVSVRSFFTVPGVDFMGEKMSFKIIYEGTDENGKTTTFIDTFKSEISCAYDPNDKMVWPNREDLDNQTLFTEDLTYRIRFQNTGTDTAFNIVVTDTLSPLLDWSTFRVMDQSHPMTTKHFDDGTVDFVFNNILLPDSHVNEPESHGYIYYKIKPKKGLDENTEIFNTAYIFFDFNPPIVTNTTRNLMVSKIVSDGVESLHVDHPLTIYPNPATHTLNIELSQSSGRLQLLNINGQTLVQKDLSTKKHQLDVSNLPTGIYLINVWQGGERTQARFVKH